MFRRSLIAGSPADWAKALRVIDSGKRVLTPVETNNLLDTLALVIDAEREARGLRLDRLARPPRPKP